MQSIYVKTETLPEAWEKAVLKTWAVGDSFPTQYDKPNDPNSRDVSCLIHVTDPTKEPCIHRAFPGGLDDLEKYRSEVLLGVHDHWIDPKAGKWEYTYHQRLFSYDVLRQDDVHAVDSAIIPLSGPCRVEFINQIAKCIEMLKACPYTRRAQAVTWQAWKDLGIDDPTCLQRLWFRIEDALPRDVQEKIASLKGIKNAAETCGDYDMLEIYEEEIEQLQNTPRMPMLNMNIHIRSNDAYKAAFMNMYAFVEIQKMVALEVGVGVGSYIHVADSLHIYGSYFDEFEGFLKTVEVRKPEDRVFSTSFAVPFFIDGCDTLLAEEDMPSDKKELVKQRKAYLEGAF